MVFDIMQVELRLIKAEPIAGFPLGRQYLCFASHACSPVATLLQFTFAHVFVSLFKLIDIPTEFFIRQRLPFV